MTVVPVIRAPVLRVRLVLLGELVPVVVLQTIDELVPVLVLNTRGAVPHSPS